MSRGRPKFNEEKILIYTQEFKQDDGSITTWHWDKTRFPNGPYLVENEEVIDPELAKLIKKRNKILSLYETPPNERKKRITKSDKQKLEELNGEIEKIQVQ